MLVARRGYGFIMTAPVAEEGGGEQTAADRDRQEYGGDSCADHSRLESALARQIEQRSDDHYNAGCPDPREHLEEFRFR